MTTIKATGRSNIDFYISPNFVRLTYKIYFGEYVQKHEEIHEGPYAFDSACAASNRISNTSLKDYTLLSSEIELNKQKMGCLELVMQNI